jgi:hypothetical protein
MLLSSASAPNHIRSLLQRLLEKRLDDARDHIASRYFTRLFYTVWGEMQAQSIREVSHFHQQNNSCRGPASDVPMPDRVLIAGKFT